MHIFFATKGAPLKLVQVKLGVSCRGRGQESFSTLKKRLDGLLKRLDMIYSPSMWWHFITPLWLILPKGTVVFPQQLKFLTKGNTRKLQEIKAASILDDFATATSGPGVSRWLSFYDTSVNIAEFTKLKMKRKCSPFCDANGWKRVMQGH